MRRYLFLAIIVVSFSFASCVRQSPVGTWIQPSANKGDIESGFALYSDGTASAVNMHFVLFDTWEVKDNMLIINGRNTGARPMSFSDTLRIVKVTKENLVLAQDGFGEITYLRKN